MLPSDSSSLKITAILKLASKMTVLLLLLILPGKALSQTGPKLLIKGIVTDKETREPVINATVFLENTTVGTVTNEKGEFTLKPVTAGTYTLAVSSVGYELQTVFIQSYENDEYNLKIELKQKTIVLGEISVVGNSADDWESNLKIFKREFLGKTNNSKETAIVNPEVINFRKEEDTRSLIASSDSTIIIDNRALGYRIFIILDLFKFSTDGVVRYVVHTRFEELPPKDENEMKDWIKKRRNAYTGSQKHFFSSLIKKQLYENGFMLTKGDMFVLQAGLGRLITPGEINFDHAEGSDIYRYEIDQWLKISCTSNDTQSLLRPISRFIHLDYMGNQLNGISFEVTGYWSEQRIADTLPYDYTIE